MVCWFDGAGRVGNDSMGAKLRIMENYSFNIKGAEKLRVLPDSEGATRPDTLRSHPFTKHRK